MKLREFSLWAYKLALEESRQFTLFNRCICAHFERHFEPIDANGIYRVVIKLGEPDSKVGSSELSNSVLKFYCDFDFGAYSRLGTAQKKEMLLRTLLDALVVICQQKGWPKQNFLDAFEAVQRESISNFYVKQSKWNRGKTKVAEIYCKHGEDVFECYLRVKNQREEVLFQRLLFSEEPDEFLFNGRIGRIKWVGVDTVAHLVDGKEIAKLDIR